MTDIYDLQGVDDDEDDLNLEGAGWYGMIFEGIDPDDVSVEEDLGIFIKHLNFDESQAYGSTGTGLFNPFLNMNGGETLIGFNLQDNSQQQNTANNTDMSNPNTNAIQMADIPIVYLDLVGDDGVAEAYYVINLDINENNQLDVALSELQIFVSDAEANFTDYIFDTDQSGLAFANTSQDYSLVFDLDSLSTGGDKTLILSDLGAGQGKQDYIFYLPVELFTNVGASQDSYMTLFSQFGPTPPDDAGFAEWNTIIAPKVAGIKFEDENGNGVQDTGEDGIGGFTMFIDIDGDGKYDEGELTAVSDETGYFEFPSLLDADQFLIFEILSSDDIDAVNNSFTAQEIDDLLPSPSGFWELTTGENGGHDIVLDGDSYVVVKVGNRELEPQIYINKTAALTDDCADEVGELITYTVQVSTADFDGVGPTSDLDLTNVVVQDNFEGSGYVTLTHTGDGDDGLDPGEVVLTGDDGDGVLEVGETWTYTYVREVTQEMIDSNGGGDAKLSNVARANSTETPQYVSDSANVDVCQDPYVYIQKDAELADEGDCVDEADDVIDYTVKVSLADFDGVGPTSNVSLTNVIVTDTFEDGTEVVLDDGNGTLAAGVTLLKTGGDQDDVLEAGETWTYTYSRDASQNDIDTNGLDGDGTLDNTADVSAAAATTGTVVTDEDSASVDVCQEPSIDVEKTVKTNLFDYQAEDADDDPDGLLAGTGSVVNFRVSVENTGNVTLSSIAMTDTVTHTINGSQTTETIVYFNDGDPTTLDAFDVFIDLSGDGVMQAGEEWSNFDTNNDGVIDAGVYAELSPGESFTIYYSLNSQLGQHENTATATAYAATTASQTSDSDDANYYVLASGDCVGVGTPGFWSNNGAPFWDGEVGGEEEEKHAGEPGFAQGELTYDVYLEDTNNDGVVNDLDDPSSVKGLLVGDYNQNGYEDNGEDTIFISLADAQDLIDASGRQVNGGQADGTWILGRDVVATWLNFLANNEDGGAGCIGEADNPYSPQAYLNDAIDWLQTFAADQNGDNSWIFEFGPKIRTKSDDWQAGGIDPDGDSFVSGAKIHDALDDYNNFGAIWDPDLEQYIEFCCDRDNAEALAAVQQVKEFYESSQTQDYLLMETFSSTSSVDQEGMMLAQLNAVA